MDAVTPIIVERAQARGGLWSRMGMSALVHAVLLPAIAIWMVAAPAEDARPREVMQISLGGAPGPRSGGMTPMAGRAAEAAPPAAKPAPVAPPPPKAAEMALPKVEKRPTPPREAPKQAPDDAKGRTVQRAAEASQGSAVAETGAKGVGFGLTTGGGQTGGYLDVANFCCPEYLGTMIQLIQRNWQSKQQVAGETLMKFVIQRDGRLTNIEVERSSGYFALDQTAQRALLVTRQLTPLPAQFTEPTLTVHLIFRYER
jgi:TonB family protein